MKQITLIFCLVFLMSCEHAETTETATSTEITKNEIIHISENSQFLELFKTSDGGILIDLRTPQEIKVKPSFPDAMNLSFSDPNFNENILKFGKEAPIFLYCAAGGRSGKAAKLLKSAGYTRIYNLENGI